MIKELKEFYTRKSSALAFCKLIVSCYFTVFSVIPLTHIHVEEESGRWCSSLREAKSHNESFLSILHEALFLHFKDREDHTLSSRATLLESPGNDNTLYDRGDAGSSPYRLSGSGLKFDGRHSGATTVKGFLIFSSGLSPPLSDITRHELLNEGASGNR